MVTGTAAFLVLFWSQTTIKPSAVCVHLRSLLQESKSHFSHCFSGNIATCFYVITSWSMMGHRTPSAGVYVSPHNNCLSFFILFIIIFCNTFPSLHLLLTPLIHKTVTPPFTVSITIYKFIIHIIIFQCYIFPFLSLLFLLLMSGFLSSSSETR